MMTDRPMRKGWDERLWAYGIGFMGLAAAGMDRGAIKYREKKHPLFYGAGTSGYKFDGLDIFDYDRQNRFMADRQIYVEGLF